MSLSTIINHNVNKLEEEVGWTWKEKLLNHRPYEGFNTHLKKGYIHILNKFRRI